MILMSSKTRNPALLKDGGLYFRKQNGGGSVRGLLVHNYIIIYVETFFLSLRQSRPLVVCRSTTVFIMAWETAQGAFATALTLIRTP